MVGPPSATPSATPFAIAICHSSLKILINLCISRAMPCGKCAGSWATHHGHGPLLCARRRGPISASFSNSDQHLLMSGASSRAQTPGSHLDLRPWLMPPLWLPSLFSRAWPLADMLAMPAASAQARECAKLENARRRRWPLERKAEERRRFL